MENQIDKMVVEFDYTKEAITKIVEEVSSIDKSDFEQVKEGLKTLVKVRTTITKQGKSFRDSANAFNKSVLAKEKEYLALTVDVEESLKKILDDEKQRQVIEARKELLPMKKEQLAMLTHLKSAMYKDITDEQILDMDDTAWVTFYQGAMQENSNEIEAEKQREIDEANREKREAEIAEQARLDGIAEQKRKEKEKAEKEKLAKEKAEREAKEEQEKLEANKRYQNFLDKNGYDPKTDIIQNDGKEVRLYRIVNTLKL